MTHTPEAAKSAANRGSDAKGEASSTLEASAGNSPKAEYASGSQQIRELKDVLVGELAIPGNWVVANVETNSFWPVNTQTVSFKGETLWILPITTKHFPAVAMRARPDQDRAECERILMRFLSTLSWVEQSGYLVDGFCGGGRPTPMGRDKTYGFAICEEFDLSYFPDVTYDKALLALALLREGRGLNHPGYAFLSFYRVLEVAFPDGRVRGNWIRDRVDAIAGITAKEALAKLRAQGIADIGIHLRDSGRRAMAHAREEPIIDPDDPADDRRLWSELPIMAALAQLAIEDSFDVKTPGTVWQQHLYELEGFKKILGADLVDTVSRGVQIADERAVDMPRINVQLRGHHPYPPLLQLVPVQIRQDGSHLLLNFGSGDRNVQLNFRLDFAAERLTFDVFNDLKFKDSGTADGALAVAELKRFFYDYFGNGQLHIYNAESGELISRKDAFIPRNMFLDSQAAKAEIAQWMKTAQARRIAT